jgi:ligand-binding sensor domain-containing protein
MATVPVLSRPVLLAGLLVLAVLPPAMGIGVASGEAGARLSADVDPFFEGWRTFGVADGLPDEKVFAVEIDGDTVWVGTEKGLAALREGADGVEVWTTAEGLPFDVVTALAVDEASGDLWIGTMGGLARLSGGRVDSYTQLDSGLANDVIYGVAVGEDRVWVVTAAGLNSYDPGNDAWQIFDTTNTLMHEPWCYGVTTSGPIVYVAVWGGGVLVHDTRTGVFREHRDPDGEMEVDLFPDDGLVHDVTSAVAFADDLLWVGTYFGLSRYDGRRWNSYAEEDSGLTSNFINTVQADARGAWIGTDLGLSYFDSTTWWTWRQREADGAHELVVHAPGQAPRATRVATGLPDNSVLGIAFDGDDLWIATAAGLAHARARTGLSRDSAFPTQGEGS